MCGICGYISKKRISDEVLIAMRDTMVHRGPDDAGIYQIKRMDRYIGLAHRRLSVFDLSEQGHQPMISENEDVSIVYNGEVYNFADIREELESCGYCFKSRCDTEVILYAYRRWGVECFSRFNGMFAIAIWDNRKNELILVRDRMGVKPLYYYHNPLSGDIIFASELKPIMKSPFFQKEINEDVLGQFFCNKYIAAPASIFKNTYKLQAGMYAIYRNGEISYNKYWDICYAKKIASDHMILDYNEAKREIEDTLTDAIAKRIVADVPVGFFLSSGTDSALITAMAKNTAKSKIKTYTIGFNDKERNEADKARLIAKYLGTDHTEFYISDAEILEMLDDITKYYDEPFADSSQLPTMLVSRLAAEDVTVALSGDGGDELFCGYRIYDLVYIAQHADAIGNILFHTPIKNSLSSKVRALANNRNECYKTQLFADVFSEYVDKMIIPEIGSIKHSFEKELNYKNWQERRMILDLKTYLPDEIMTKTDRASMKYSLEVRSPLLDYRVVEKSFEIPHGYKYSYFDKKHILKDLAADYIPISYLSGSKKGFGVPLRKWLRGPLDDEISKYVDKSYLKRQELFDYNQIVKLVTMQKKTNNRVCDSLLWSYYMFQRWWNTYIDDSVV